MVSAYIGLGSNLDQPEQQVTQAIEALKVVEKSRLVRVSSLYVTPPMGPKDQPDFVNAVVQLETALSPEEMLEQLQQIELDQGRVRTRHWGERTLDLDLLLYGQMVINLPHLSIPHPGMAERAFVLVPLQEIAGSGLQVPGVGRLGQLTARCDRAGIRKIA